LPNLPHKAHQQLTKNLLVKQAIKLQFPLVTAMAIDFSRVRFLRIIALALLLFVVFLHPSSAAPLTIDSFLADLTEYHYYPSIERIWDPLYVANSRNTNNIFIGFSNVLNIIYEKYVEESQFTRVLEITAGGARSFNMATHVISGQKRFVRSEEGFSAQTPLGNSTALYWNLNLDTDRFPFEDDFFDFVYCHHVLQDLSNPAHAFEELTRVARNGFVESPSPLMSTLLWDEYANLGFRGHPRHRFLLWTERESNTLHMIPKFPLMDQILPSLYGSLELETSAAAIVGQVYSVGADYYSWHDPADALYTAVDRHTNRTVSIELSRRRPRPNQRVKMIKHDIDYNFQSLVANGGYPSVIRQGVRHSIENAIAYFEEFVHPLMQLVPELQ